jgi:hypothetical protein
VLKYLGMIGNVFHTKDIEIASEKGHKYNPPSNIDEVNYYTQKSIGIDPGFGSSAFGVVVTQMSDRLMQVLEAEEYNRPDFNQMKMYYFRSKDEDTREDAYIYTA